MPHLPSTVNVDDYAEEDHSSAYPIRMDLERDAPIGVTECYVSSVRIFVHDEFEVEAAMETRVCQELPDNMLEYASVKL